MARLARITAGFTLLTAGAAMLVLPGPGVLTIVAGLGVLAKDLHWADRLSTSIRARFVGRHEELPESITDGRPDTPADEPGAGIQLGG